MLFLLFNTHGKQIYSLLIFLLSWWEISNFALMETGWHSYLWLPFTPLIVSSISTCSIYLFSIENNVPQKNRTYVSSTDNLGGRNKTSVYNHRDGFKDSRKRWCGEGDPSSSTRRWPLLVQPPPSPTLPHPICSFSGISNITHNALLSVSIMIMLQNLTAPTGSTRNQSD